MLQSFNDKFKGPFTWFIVVSISIIFVISGMTFFFANFGSSRSYVAKVGNNEISSQQFQQYSQGVTSDIQKKSILSQMIDQYLMLADAQSHNIVVSKLAIQSEIFNNPMFFDKSGKFSTDKIKQVASYLGGMQILEQMIAQNIQATIIPKTIMDTSLATNYNTKSLINAYFINKNIDYLKISPSDFKSQVKPSNQDLQKYYNDHKSDYVKPAQKNISYFIVTKDNFLSKDKISENEIKSYYDSHKELFKSFDDKAKDTIEKIIQNRKALEQFNEYLQNIDINKFSNLKKKLGDPQITTIIDNNSITISDIVNSKFFANSEKFESIPLSDNEVLVYQVNNSTNAVEQKLNDIKDKVIKDYTVQQSQEIALQQAQKYVNNLNKGEKITKSFKQAVISNDSKDFSAGFNNYVMFNSNNQYHYYKDDNGDIYIYKVTKVDPVKNQPSQLPNQVINAYKQEELNFYSQIIKQKIPVKINYQNI
ncbi:MAG: peptidylprolyl isomerase [Francisella sp.]